MNDPGLTNLRWAYGLVDGLAQGGLRYAVISPGSRSTPLVLACRQHPRIQTRVHLDERAAAFLALGLARGRNEPVALIATSGSAPAHWFPAVLEASASQVPLLLLSADRPPELQDWGANQTLDQSRLFGVHVRAFFQAGLPEEDPDLIRQIQRLGAKAVARACWPLPGPVHLNLPFREPLVPQAPADAWPRESPDPVAVQQPRLMPQATAVRQLADLLNTGPGLLICGPDTYAPDFPQALLDLAARLGAPVFADPLSNLRFGPWSKDRILSRYDRFLRREADALPKPAWVLRFGAAPTSKALCQYLAAQAVPQILVDPWGRWRDPSHRSHLVQADPALLCTQLLPQIAAHGQDWHRPFWEAESRAQHQEAELDRIHPSRLIPALMDQLPEGSWLLSGNSLAIRYLDAWSGCGEKRLRIFCNRGTSGIDGTVSTLMGLSIAKGEKVVGLVGDLSLAHDLNGFWNAADREAVVIVLDNGGGGIFRQLPQAQLPDFETYWGTPPGLDLAQVATLFRLGFQRVTMASEFRPALQRALATKGAQLIAVSLDSA